jgi:hypothetical protein
LLTVAGTDVRTHSHYPLVDDAADSAYLPFLTPDLAGTGLSPAIDVEVRVSPAPLNDSATVFDSDYAWRMQPEMDGYRVSFRRMDRDSIHTVMCADRLTSNIQIYVHQDEPPEVPLSQGVGNPVRAPLDQVLFMNHLAPRGGVICHAAAAVVDGCALLFPGVSGAGKSTMCRKFAAAGLGETLLSDDRVILRVPGSAEGQPETITASGTPWHGDALIARNESAPLAAVLFLVQATKDEVVPITPGQAMRRLMPLVSSPWYDAERLPAVLETCGRIVETVPCYDLHFTRDGDAVSMVTGRLWG